MRALGVAVVIAFLGLAAYYLFADHPLPEPRGEILDEPQEIVVDPIKPAKIDTGSSLVGRQVEQENFMAVTKEGSVEDPYAHGHDAGAALNDAAIALGWERPVEMANTRLWLEPCKTVQGGSPVQLSPEELRRISHDLPMKVKLRQFCGYLVDVVEVDLEDYILDQLEQTLDGGSGDLPHHWMTSEETDRLRGQDPNTARNLVVEKLVASLDRLDEAGVRTALLGFLQSDSELVYPPNFQGEHYAFSLYHYVLHDVATALLCTELAGCQGEDHPMVIRTCIEAYQRTLGCVAPRDILDAIYQAQTPVEHDVFWQFLNQVSVMIARYRRGR